MIFLIDKTKNNGYPYIQDMPEFSSVTLKKPYPHGIMVCMGEDVNDGYPGIPELDIYIAGAFMNAVNLEYVRIPETVRQIGKYAFRNTALQKVKISSECDYYKTSFPENCVIEFYGNSLNKSSGQLYDCNKNVLIDSDGARIYVQEEYHGR
ncbi:MAG: leucine-rich repeat domain-containing protein [Ruminococcus sp.]|nr:leucine-rich repeat domain-containing protein [Ruminococcus sp.]